VVAMRCISIMRAEMSIWLEKSKYRVSPEMTTKIGTPINSSARKKIMINKVVIGSIWLGFIQTRV